ncbi:MAG: hypothetical protein GC152_14455 [Alphaproteobacteria bacterium]|nr:hypothetical protein [Alphaproteobacteria bacterium]
MSVSIKAGAVVAEAVEFGWRRLPAVLRFAWAPMLFASMVTVGALGVLFDPAGVAAEGAVDGVAVGDPWSVMRAPGWIVGIAGLVLSALWCIVLGGVYTDIFRLVATGEDAGRFVNVRLDGPAFRTAAAFTMMILLNLVLTVVAALVAQSVTGVGVGEAISNYFKLIRWTAAAGGAAGQPPVEIVDGVVASVSLFLTTALLSVVPGLYLSTKLAPFPAGTAVEDRLIPLKSFRVTRGHAWSILAALLLLSAALGLLSLVLGMAFGILDLVGQTLGGAGVLLNAISALAQAGLQFFAFGAQAAFGAIIYRRLVVEPA